ncbi:hydroxypyruvate isomerase family protein [Acidobacteriota bacterium]
MIHSTKKLPSLNDRISRRKFINVSAASISVAALSTSPLRAVPTGKAPGVPEKSFQLKYAPSLGSFREHAGKDPIDNIKFMADQGFRAMFDNGLMNKSPELQEAIGKEMDRHGMTMGPFVAYADFKVESFVLKDSEIRKMLTERMKMAVETAQRANVKWTLVVPGRYNQRMEWDYQTANVVENLKYLSNLCESSGLVMVIEPLNPWDHPGLFLVKMPQAYQVCKAVNSPYCKIIDDMYHQQISEGNIIPNIDRAWDEIASFHIGDNPGRKEPGTGEINYKNVFKFIHGKNYSGVLCMEHGKSLKGLEGEKALLAAYRNADSF